MPDRKKIILVVDDEKSMARALELKLGFEGFETRSAPDGQSALDIIEKEYIDLILLDLMMPRLDGFRFLEILKQRKNKVPLIVLTNLSQSEDEDRARALGAKEFFVKSDTPIATIVARVKASLT